MTERRPYAGYALGLAAALAGAALGHRAVGWMLGQGFYAMMLPGTLVGVGGGLFLPDRSRTWGAFVGTLALMAGLYTEWDYMPFIKDPGFGYFLAHCGDLKPVSLLMIAGGGFLGTMFGQGRPRR